MDFIDMFNLGPDRDERLLHHAMFAFDGANLLHVLDRRLKRAAAPRRSLQRSRVTRRSRVARAFQGRVRTRG